MLTARKDGLFNRKNMQEINQYYFECTLPTGKILTINRIPSEYISAVTMFRRVDGNIECSVEGDFDKGLGMVKEAFPGIDWTRGMWLTKCN